MQANCRTSGSEEEQLSLKAFSRSAVAETLNPDADHQRWYICGGCGDPCINPIGTVPERRDLCLTCATSSPSERRDRLRSRSLGGDSR